MAVRNESVRLSLIDDFTTPMARAAAATALLQNRLNDLDGTNVRAGRGMATMARDVDAVGASTRRVGADIDKFSGRLRIMADLAAVLGPGLVPIGAVAVPAITALASQLGFAAIGAGSLVAAAQGVGDALTAVNEAALEPTAENLDKAREAMGRLGPEAREFVTAFQEFRPVLTDIRDSAAAGWFPGLTESLDHLAAVGPQVGDIFQAIGERGGALLAEGAEALGGEEWREFFTFVQNTAPGALESLGRSAGNVASGLADLWMAFDPLNQDIAGGILDASAAFERWADGLAETQGFQDFLEYVRENGPRVADAAVAIGNAVLQIVEAAAPLGGPVLQGLTAVANVIAAIADSEAGPAILAAAAAMGALSRAQAMFGALAGTSWAQNIAGARGYQAQMATLSRTMTGIGTAVAGFAFAQSGLAESLQLSNTAMGVMAGSMAGPYGAALGAGIGFALDFAAANREIADAVRSADEAAAAGDLEALIEQRDRLLEQLNSVSGQASGILSDPFGAVSDVLSGDLDDLALGGDKTAAALRRTNDEIDRLTLEQAGSGVASFGSMMEGATREIEQFANSFRDLQSLLDQSGSLVSYEAALDNLTASVRENGNAWSASGEKGRANITAVNDLTSKAIDRANVLFEANKRMAAQRVLTRAIGDLRQFAETSPRAAQVINPLIKGLRDLNSERAEPKANLHTEAFFGRAAQVRRETQALDKAGASVSVGADVGAALSGIGAVRSALASIPRSITTVVNTVRNFTRGGFADGGFTGPGRKHEVAGLVHRGEVVIPQELVRRDWDMLRGRYGHLPGFADGGVVGSTFSRSRADDGGATASLRGLAKAGNDAAKGIKGMQRRLEELERRRERLQSRASDIRSGISGLLDDPFESSGSVWSAGGGINPLGVLGGDIAELRRQQQLQRQLRRRGLSGAAFENAVATGGVEGLEALAGYSRQELARYERLYMTRQRLTNQAGNQAIALSGLQREMRENRNAINRVEAAIKREGKNNRDNRDKNTDRRNRAQNDPAKNARRRAQAYQNTGRRGA